MMADRGVLSRVRDGGLPRCPRLRPPDGASPVQSPGARRTPGSAASVQIHRTLSPAPFLKCPQLTPAQRSFLCGRAAARGLILQHYMNVLHRCIAAGDRVDATPEAVAAQENTGTQSRRTKGPDKTDKKRKKRSRSGGNAAPPKAAARESRPPAAPKPPRLKRRRALLHTSRSIQPASQPARSRSEDQPDEPGGSLSGCLSSLSVGGDDESVLSL